MSKGLVWWPKSSPRQRSGPDAVKQMVDEIQGHIGAAATGLTQLAEVIDAGTSPTNQIRVRSGDDLQKAIDQAATQTGAVDIRIEPGARFAGNYLLRKHPVGAMIRLRPDFDDNNLTPQGKWIEPQHDGLPTLKSANNLNGIFECEAGANGYAFMGLRFEPLAKDRDMVIFGRYDTMPADQMRGFSVDRCHFRGDPAAGQHRGIMANCADMIVSGCYMENFFEIGRDSQCIAAWNSLGGHELAYNFLEASAENVIYGGATSKPQHVATDIHVHHNYFTKDLVWQSMPSKPSVKNLFELKNARRVVVEHNLFEHCWLHAQVGYAFVMTPEAQITGETWVTVDDVVLQFNWMRRVGGILNMNAGQNRDNTTRTSGTKNFRMRHNLFEDVNNDPQWKGEGRFAKIGNNDSNPDGPIGVVLEHNTVRRMKAASLVTLYGNHPTMSGFKLNNNIVYQGTYGVHAPEFALGDASLIGYAPDREMTGNVIEKGSSTIKFAPGNVLVPAGSIEPSIDPMGRLLGGSPVQMATVVTTDGATVGADMTQYTGPRPAD